MAIGHLSEQRRGDDNATRSFNILSLICCYMLFTIYPVILLTILFVGVSVLGKCCTRNLLPLKNVI